MESQLHENSSSLDNSFNSRFKDEIKLASIFRESSSVKELLSGLKMEMRSYFESEAFTIYFADTKNKQLVSKVKAGRLRREIRLPIDKTSIAGYAALTGSTVSISNAYDKNELESVDPDLQHNRAWDNQTKFITRQVLLTPIFCRKKLFGVIQLLNKRGDKKFTQDDVENIGAVSEALGRFISDHHRAPRKPKKEKTTKAKTVSKKSDPYSILVDNELLSEEQLSVAKAQAQKERLTPGLFQELYRRVRRPRVRLGSPRTLYSLRCY